MAGDFLSLSWTESGAGHVGAVAVPPVPPSMEEPPRPPTVLDQCLWKRSPGRRSSGHDCAGPAREAGRDRASQPGWALGRGSQRAVSELRKLGPPQA